MISAIVIVASIVLGVAFTFAWRFRPGLRDEIERPKHWFQDQVRRYDRACRGDDEGTRGRRREANEGPIGR